MSVICVTGQMAAGKNYICSQYENDGWISVDADKVVHEAVEACKSKIIETFAEIAKSNGVELLDADGKIIRRNLGSVIFGNAELLKKQEEIVYPYVTDYIKRFIEEHEDASNSMFSESNAVVQNSVSTDSNIPASKSMYGEDSKSQNIIINAVVLYKIPELLKLCEKIVYVKSSFIKRLIRARRRDKLPVAKIIARFKSQKNLFPCYAAAAKEYSIPLEIVKN